MLHTKEALLAIVDDELEERKYTETLYEPADSGAIREEILALCNMRHAIETEQQLSFNDYVWLADLVATYTEFTVRDSSC